MIRITAAALLLLSLCSAGMAHAGADATRARLEAELTDAIRQGDWPILDDGSTPRSRNPAAYPARPQPQATRAAVEAQRVGALQLGLAPVLDDGRRPRDLAPGAFAGNDAPLTSAATRTTARQASLPPC